jgi:hypothetical protein
MMKDGMKMMGDPTMMIIKVVAVAAKFLIDLLLKMRKRPVVHWDPSLRAAHVLLWHRAPMDVKESQTGILVRDMMDNGTWGWCLQRKQPRDEDWVPASLEMVQMLRHNKTFGFDAAREVEKYKEYNKKKVSFCVHPYWNKKLINVLII